MCYRLAKDVNVSIEGQTGTAYTHSSVGLVDTCSKVKLYTYQEFSFLRREQGRIVGPISVQLMPTSRPIAENIPIMQS